MDRLAIEFINVFGMPPVEFIELAARLRCRNVGLAASPVVTLPGLFPEWSLLGDPALRKATAKALADNGVSISLAEGFLVLPGDDGSRHGETLDLMAELGAPRVNVCSLAPDFAANVEGFGRLAEQAGERGLSATVEFLPGMTIGSFADALRLVEQVGRDNAGVLVDSMHLFRAGGTADDLRTAPPEFIGYAQICDVPLVSKYENYADEARYHRLPPGDGELPLRDFVDALPADVIIGFEVPMRSAVEQSADWEALLRPVIEKSRGYL
jgi:sugar phosphate isomerase/epimerase